MRDVAALSRIGNVIPSSVKRALHGTIGYHEEDNRSAEGDRLIWAGNIKRVTERFTHGELTLKARLAATSGMSGPLQSALASADRAPGRRVPFDHLKHLAGQEGADSVAANVAQPPRTSRFVAALGMESAHKRIRPSLWQQQRLALARALLRDPPLFIFDKATSMYDLEGEAAFVENCIEALKGLTVIIITHRPASLALADRIIEATPAGLIPAPERPALGS